MSALVMTLGVYAEPALVALLDATRAALVDAAGTNIMGEQVNPRLVKKLSAALRRASPFMLQDCWCTDPDHGGRKKHLPLCRKIRVALKKAGQQR